MRHFPLTHIGSNWRKLCDKYDLDPLEATTEEVDFSIRAAAVGPILGAYDRIVSRQADAIPEIEKFHAWLIEFYRLTGALEAAIQNSFIVPANPPRQEDIRDD